MLRPVMLTFQGMKSELRLRPGMLFKTVWLKATGDSAPERAFCAWRRIYLLLQ